MEYPIQNVKTFSKLNLFPIRAGRDEHHPVPAGEGRGHRRAHAVGRHGGALRGAQGDEGGARPRVRRGRLHRQGQGQRRIQGGLIPEHPPITVLRNSRS